MKHFIGKKENPDIPTPERKENPYQEQLTHPHQVHDPRSTMHKKPEPVLRPNFNRLYGGLRVDGEWRYLIDNYASGSLTTIAATTVSTPITLKNTPNWRTSQWPGALQLFLCIRGFSLGPTTAVFAVGGIIDCAFIDSAGQFIPLGELVSSTATNNLGMDLLIPTAISDPANSAVGTLLTTLNVGATIGTYNYQLSFSGAYLMPELHGYDTVYKDMDTVHEKESHRNSH